MASMPGLPKRGCREPVEGCGEEVGVDLDSDSALIEASFAAPERFGVLYERHARRLARYLIRRVGPDHGEELLGEVFRIAFETRHRYQVDRADALPWLYGIAANLVMRHNRRITRRRPIPGSPGGRCRRHTPIPGC